MKTNSGVPHVGLEVCASAAMAGVMRLVSRAAAGDAKVLITGESGVGKDLVARSLHVQSARLHGPFVAVNCAGLTESFSSPSCSGT